MKSINSNAPVTCSKSININTTAEKVWQLLTAIDNWATWQKEISNPVLNGKLIPGSTFTWKTGGASIYSTLHTVQPFQYFGWTGRTFGMYAIHNWTLTEQNAVTTVTADESMEGFIARLFRKAFSKNLERGMENWLMLLKHACENE